jgi:hypothetical protein
MEKGYEMNIVNFIWLGWWSGLGVCFSAGKVMNFSVKSAGNKSAEDPVTGLEEKVKNLSNEKETKCAMYEH